MRFLFVCTGNTCRSPMAEGILKDIAKKKNLDIQVSSAGIFAHNGEPISSKAIEAMKQIGIDISDYRSKSLNEKQLRDADIILTMGHSHKHFIEDKYRGYGGKVFTLLEYVYGFKNDISDPYGGDLNIYKEIRDEIYQAIREMEYKEEER